MSGSKESRSEDKNMSNGKTAQLSEEEKSAYEWICGPYFSAVYALLDSNRTYLNQGISWSIGILTAVIFFLFTYVAPLQEIKAPDGTVTGRSFEAMMENMTDADVLLLTSVISLSFAFVSNFLSRSMKGYLNLIRYVGLYSRCIRLCSSVTPVTSKDLGEFTGHIKQYDDDFCPPLPPGTVFWKMITELGYGMFFGILFLLYAIAIFGWFDVETAHCSLLFWGVAAFGPVWLIIELHFLSHVSSYFRYRAYRIETWAEVAERK